eukprot:2750804-Rhodomonas_salina.3
MCPTCCTQAGLVPADSTNLAIGRYSPYVVPRRGGKWTHTCNCVVFGLLPELTKFSKSVAVQKCNAWGSLFSCHRTCIDSRPAGTPGCLDPVYVTYPGMISVVLGYAWPMYRVGGSDRRSAILIVSANSPYPGYRVPGVNTGYPVPGYRVPGYPIAQSS